MSEDSVSIRVEFTVNTRARYQARVGVMIDEFIAQLPNLIAGLEVTDYGEQVSSSERRIHEGTEPSGDGAETEPEDVGIELSDEAGVSERVDAGQNAE